MNTYIEEYKCSLESKIECLIDFLESGDYEDEDCSSIISDFDTVYEMIILFIESKHFGSTFVLTKYLFPLYKKFVTENISPEEIENRFNFRDRISNNDYTRINNEEDLYEDYVKNEEDEDEENPNDDTKGDETLLIRLLRKYGNFKNEILDSYLDILDFVISLLDENLKYSFFKMIMSTNSGYNYMFGARSLTKEVLGDHIMSRLEKYTNDYFGANSLDYKGREELVAKVDDFIKNMKTLDDIKEARKRGYELNREKINVRKILLDIIKNFKLNNIEDVEELFGTLEFLINKELRDDFSDFTIKYNITWKDLEEESPLVIILNILQNNKTLIDNCSNELLNRISMTLFILIKKSSLCIFSKTLKKEFTDIMQSMDPKIKNQLMEIIKRKKVLGKINMWLECILKFYLNIMDYNIDDIEDLALNLFYKGKL